MGRDGSSMQKGAFGLNGAHLPKFSHFGSNILAHEFPKFWNALVSSQLFAATHTTDG